MRLKTPEQSEEKTTLAMDAVLMSGRVEAMSQSFYTSHKVTASLSSYTLDFQGIVSEDAISRGLSGYLTHSAVAPRAPFPPAPLSKSVVQATACQLLSFLPLFGKCDVALRGLWTRIMRNALVLYHVKHIDSETQTGHIVARLDSGGTIGSVFFRSSKKYIRFFSGQDGCMYRIYFT